MTRKTYCGNLLWQSGLTLLARDALSDLTGGVPPEAPEGDARRSWTNCHAMSINGKQSNITDDDLLEIAGRYAIGSAETILSEVKAVFC